MTEIQINEFLIKTRKTSELFYRLGLKPLAQQILATGSAVATYSLTVQNIKNRPFVCQKMSHRLRGLIAQRTYIEHGVCVYCDHLEGEELEQTEQIREDL